MSLTAHQLAQQLLAGPDLTVGLATECHGCAGPYPGHKIGIYQADDEIVINDWDEIEPGVTAP